jgi:hypothetical protein
MIRIVIWPDTDKPEVVQSIEYLKALRTPGAECWSIKVDNKIRALNILKRCKSDDVVLQENMVYSQDKIYGIKVPSDWGKTKPPERLCECGAPLQKRKQFCESCKVQRKKAANAKYWKKYQKRRANHNG